MDRAGLILYFSDIMLDGLSIRSDSVCGIYHCEPDWAWSCPGYRDYDIWLVVEGIGRMETADAE